MAINEISISMQRTAGVYSCDYQVQQLGRLIDSQPSNKVHLSPLADLITKSPSTISKTPTYETDREMITKTPPSYTSAEYSTSSSAPQMTTEIEHKFKAIKTSTFQSYTLSQWTHQTDWTNSSSNDNDVMLTKVYYSIGSLLCVLVMVLLIFLFYKFCLPTKRKKRSRKTSFWMNSRTSSKSRKTSPSFQIPMIVHVEEENVYEQPNPCTTFMDLLPSPNPSNNQGSFVHSADLYSVINDNV
ncbi:uncharacterized protein [Eleutherodactylus coqui]|uniref:uncharacterized protein isoform X3 n=1 Tax=Eleutherodactylus coqui TaxID=57060 RepID=UPI003462A009